MNRKYFNDNYSSLDEFRDTAEEVISIKILKRKCNSMQYVYREYSRKVLNRYGGSYQSAIIKAEHDGYFTEWDEERIKAAFNNGNGTMSDFRNYMENNILFSVYRKARK